MSTNNSSYAINSFNWINGNLDRFTPWRENKLSMEGLQSLSELAIIYTKLFRDSSICEVIGITPDSLKNWKHHIVSILEMPAFFELARKRPIHSFPYLLPYLVMRSSGWTNIFYEETLQLFEQDGFPFCQEVVPFRELDVLYFFNKANLTAIDLMPVYHRTFLSKMKNRIHIDNESAYSITHTLLYLSDFARQKLPLPPNDISRIQQILESLMVHYWRSHHWDLLGEILLCLQITGLPDRSLFSYAKQAFYKEHDSDGSIVGHGEQSEELAAARLIGDNTRLFTCNYHTTIVSLLLSFQLISNEIKN